MMPETGRIYQGDCLEVMRSWPDKCVDLVLTDPPYGVKRDKGFGGSQSFGGKVGKKIERRVYDDKWDSEIPPPEVFHEILRVSKHQMFFGGNFFAHLLPPSKHWIFWDKLQTMPTFGDGELIWTSFPKSSIKKYTFQFNGLLTASEDTREHPTQKPSELIGQLIRDYTEPDWVIGDCYIGSGTTALAAEQNGRKWVGIEIDPKYVAIAEARVAAEVAQGKLQGILESCPLIPILPGKSERMNTGHLFSDENGESSRTKATHLNYEKENHNEKDRN